MRNPIYDKLQKVFYSQERSIEAQRLRLDPSDSSENQSFPISIKPNFINHKSMKCFKPVIDKCNKSKVVRVHSPYHNEIKSLKRSMSVLEGREKNKQEIEIELQRMVEKLNYYQRMEEFYLQELQNRRKSEANLQWKLDVVVAQLRHQGNSNLSNLTESFSKARDSESTVFSRIDRDQEEEKTVFFGESELTLFERNL